MTLDDCIRNARASTAAEADTEADTGEFDTYVDAYMDGRNDFTQTELTRHAAIRAEGFWDGFVCGATALAGVLGIGAAALYAMGVWGA